LNNIEDAIGAILRCEWRTGKVVWREAQIRRPYTNIGAINLNWFNGSGERLYSEKKSLNQRILGTGRDLNVSAVEIQIVSAVELDMKAK